MVVAASAMRMPPAMPSIPPSTPAPSNMPNSQDPKPGLMSGASGLRRGPWAPGKARHETDQIAAIVQPLVIDRPIAGGIGHALDQEDRAASRHLKRLGGNRVGRGPGHLNTLFVTTEGTYLAKD